ncbi:Ig-like domain-containing protein, partial [Bifidobacterium sp. 64T4]|uniref:Ig-like domain-containing protein n=1 Tax=Bifidobacterium pongonis TaxID=2834432 RepID=UPI001C57D8C4
VKVSFTNGTSWDGNGKAADGSLRGYWASGSSMAVASGQVIAGAVPTCSVEETPDVPVTSVAISGTGVSAGKLSVKQGASAQLTATVNPSNATDKTVTWKSSNTAVATVANGKVTGVKAGTATITATAGGKSASVTVTVTSDDVVVPVTSVTISGATSGKLSVKKGASAQLTATVGPSNATYKTVTWTSSNTAVATVDRTGKVTGVKAGTATITAKAGSKTATVTVTVTEDSSSLTIVGSTHSVAPETMQFTVKGLPADANTNQITWSVSGSNLTGTNNPGRTFKVWGTRATTGVVTVKYQDQTASVPVTVDSYSYDSAPTIAVDQQSLTMKVGDSVKLNYTVTPSNSPFKLAIFDAWNEDVAFADGDGTIHAIGTGSTTVRVWSARGTNYTDVKVTVS